MPRNVDMLSGDTAKLSSSLDFSATALIKSRLNSLISDVASVSSTVRAGFSMPLSPPPGSSLLEQPVSITPTKATNRMNNDFFIISGND